MGFDINDEHKIRITLSERAYAILIEDMDIFGINKLSTIINTIFYNYKHDAKASINLYREQRILELNQLLANTHISTSNRDSVISAIYENEYTKIKEQIKLYDTLKGSNKLYHINKENIDYLTYECTEEEEYGYRPGKYLRAVIEEYCELPFIKRERIIKKDIYEKIVNACQNHNILKIHIVNQISTQLFYVYPYKIVTDPLSTRSYLVCYSRKAEDDDKNKVIASFSLSRLNMPTTLKGTFTLTKSQITTIEQTLINNSAAYLIGKTEQIKVKLTNKGKQIYKTKLTSRPQKIDSLSTDDIYVFNCSHHQIYNYFFSFGGEAEIISPIELRYKFMSAYTNAVDKYNNLIN